MDKGGKGTGERTVCKRGGTASYLHKELLPLPSCGDGTEEGGLFCAIAVCFHLAINEDPTRLRYRGSAPAWPETLPASLRL